MNAQSSLPFGGGPFYVSVFWATFALWQGTELVLNTKRRSASPVGRSDRGSFRLLFLSLWMAISLDFACALLLPSAAVASAGRKLFVVGICCVLAGTALRWYAVVTLGRYFAFGYRIAVEEAALLSTVGEPYARYMRRTWRLIPYLF
jgi:protein-S-isoprenylcysteine O-methyltransferase Ste14